MRKIILFGAGNQGKNALNKLRGKVCYFCDNNANVQGTIIKGIKVLSYEEMITLYGKEYVVIVTPNNSESMVKQLEENGIFDYLIYEKCKERIDRKNRWDNILKLWWYGRKQITHSKIYDDFSIVIQGPVADDRIIKAISFYKNNYYKAHIIVSTWNTIDNQMAERIRSTGAELITTELPSICGRANVNYQIISTYEGIKRAKEIGTKYVIKVRSNNVITAVDLFDRYREFILNDKGEEHKNYGLNHKILLEYRENFYDSIPFGICDLISMGCIEDMEKLWGIPLDVGNAFSNENMCSSESEKRLSCGKTVEELFKERASAILWISLGFCESIGYQAECNNMLSKKYYRDLFVFVDQCCDWLFKYEDIGAKRLCFKTIMYTQEVCCNNVDTNRVLFGEEYYESEGYKEYIRKKNG